MVTERFDAVVIGSGFGGSVMAYRLAHAGLRVCLLERGKPYPPGSFARTPFELRNNFWDPSEKRYGLFNIWSFRGMAAIVSSGLGGGSLIYANVFLRKDDRWFSDPLTSSPHSWPITRAQLDPHYDAVQRIVGLEVYPKKYGVDNKTAAMRNAAAQLNINQTLGDGDPAKPQWFLPDLAVTFTVPGRSEAQPGRVFDPGDNYHQLPRETCRLCGECDVGCNYGAKNTMDYTYITLAEKVGADIRPMCEVKDFTPVGEGRYEVHYVAHDVDRQTVAGVVDETQLHTITTDRVILSAGTLGSTYLLLKMKHLGVLPQLSQRLGSRFSGNGDLLMFATRCQDEGMPRRLNASRAPVITSTFRFPDGEDTGGPERGFYLQDAGYPLAVDYMWEMLDRSLLQRIGRAAFELIRAYVARDVRAEIDRELGEGVGSGELSSTSMPLLGMGRDVPTGQMSVRDDPVTKVPMLELAWSDAPSRGYLDGAIARGRQVAQALGGSFTENPLTWIFNDLITVHPLGGCPMGNSIEEGVVSPRGEVFNYPGLYVADGSILPGPVGANPSFTIAAVSDLIADEMLTDSSPSVSPLQ
jgi:cholesterol oxidase